MPGGVRRALARVECRGRCALLVGLIRLVGTASCSNSATMSPERVAVQFYTMRDAIGTQGAPSGSELAALRPFIADSLAHRLAYADTLRRGGTIPASDSTSRVLRGDLFSSLFEGPSTFRVMPGVLVGAHVAVPVECASDRVRPAVRWTDTILVTRERERYVVHDIRFGAVRGENRALSLLARLSR